MKEIEMNNTILNIQASPRGEASVTQQLSQAVLRQLNAGQIITRDLTTGLPLLTGEWVSANSTAPEERSSEERNILTVSDKLITEIKQADTLVLGVPVHNFSVPAVLKAWIDQIARVGVTFKYTATGPVGLLSGKRAIILMASGGMPIGSDIDFASGYLKHIMGFIGITDVTIIAADALAANAEEKIAEAHAKIATLN